jgi:hypothetical protein
MASKKKSRPHVLWQYSNGTIKLYCTRPQCGWQSPKIPETQPKRAQRLIREHDEVAHVAVDKGSQG